MLSLARRKREAEAIKLELANATTAGHLISYELVETHMFGALEGFTKRLLGDASKTIPLRLYNMARAGETIEAGQSAFRAEVSKHLLRAKDTVLRLLASTPRAAQHPSRARNRKSRKK